jgi:hypothetical protein
MVEWAVHVSHTTIMRWVHRYVTDSEKWWNRRANAAGSSWLMDETYIQARPGPRPATSIAPSTSREGPSNCDCRPSAESLRRWAYFPQCVCDLRVPIRAQDHPGWS